MCTRLVELCEVYWSYKSTEKREVGNMLVNNLEISIVSRIESRLIYRIVCSCK